jgi:hypothetical protein
MPSGLTVSGGAAMPGGDDEFDLQARPSDILLGLIVAFLAPLFMGSTTDVGLARLSVLETLASYQARTQAELVSIAQIIGYGLAVLDTLRLAMLPDVSVAMKLRLRGCANALNRSAQQNIRALERGRQDGAFLRPGIGEPAAMPVDPATTGFGLTEADVKAAVAGARNAVLDVHARMRSAALADRSAAAGPKAAPPVAAPTSVALPVVAPSAVAPTAVTPAATAPAVAAPSVVAPSVVAPAPVVPSVAAPSAVAPTSVIASGVARSGMAPAVAASPAAQPAPVQSAIQSPAGAGTVRPRILTAEQQNKLMWASAMSGVAGELTGTSASPITQPMSKSDLMWADTLASVARHLVAEAEGKPDTADVPHFLAGTPPKRT